MIKKRRNKDEYLFGKVAQPINAMSFFTIQFLRCLPPVFSYVKDNEVYSKINLLSFLSAVITT